MDSGTSVAAKKASEPTGVSTEIESKVVSYLVDCGMDPATISVKDIDEQSLIFLAEHAEKSSKVEETMKHEEMKPPTIETSEHEMKIASAVAASNDMKDTDRDDTFRTRDIDIQNYDEPDSFAENASESDHNCLNESFNSFTTTRGGLDRLEAISASLNTLSEKPKNSEPRLAGVGKSEVDIDMDMDALEPWQKAMFQKLDQQAKEIERLQGEIITLTKIVALARAENSAGNGDHNVSFSSVDQGAYAHGESDRDNSYRNQFDVRNAPGAAQQPADAQTFLAHFFDGMFYIPRKTYHYVRTSRPVRIIKAVRREADNFYIPGNRNQAFLDFHLMFKLIFICLFLRARMGPSGRRGYQTTKASGIFGEMLNIWKEYSSTLLVVAAVIVYFIQTGLILFLYKITIQDNVIGRILANKDLDENNNQNNAADAAAENQNAVRVRRGRRDRAPIQNNIIGNDANVAPGAVQQNGDPGEARQEGGNNAQQGRGVGRLNMNLNLNETFIGGMVDRPFDGHEGMARNLPREEVFLGQMIEGMKDVLYLFGSFFLSIFPMWRPRQRERPSPEPEPVADPQPEPQPEAGVEAE